jgi:hypothetical protein
MVFPKNTTREERSEQMEVGKTRRNTSVTRFHYGWIGLRPAGDLLKSFSEHNF